MLHQPRGVRATGTQAGSLGGQEGAPEPERRGVGDVVAGLGCRVCQAAVSVGHGAAIDPSPPCSLHHPDARRTMIQRKGLLLSYLGPSLETLWSAWRGGRQAGRQAGLFPIAPAALCLLTFHSQDPEPGRVLALRVAGSGGTGFQDLWLPPSPSFSYGISPHLGFLLCRRRHVKHNLPPIAGLNTRCMPRMGSGQHLGDHSLEGF